MSLSQIKVELCSAWGSDKDAAHAAWASTYDVSGLDQKSDEDIRRMASNIVVHAHDTPKERVWMEWFITCPIFVERQFDKYRMSVQYQDIQVSYLQAPFGRAGITQNELSGRYRTLPDRPYSLPRDVVDILIKATTAIDVARPNEGARIAEAWNKVLEDQHNLYQNTLHDMREAEKKGGITNVEYKRAREVVRGLLGTAFLTDMRLVFNGNAFEWIVGQRIDEHAQVESQVVAYKLLVGARDNNVAGTMVQAMIDKHGWQSRIDAIEAQLKADANV